MKNFNQNKTLQAANDNFSKQEYEKALLAYALVLKADPNNKEAYNGAILAEMAMSGEEAAAALWLYSSPPLPQGRLQAGFGTSEMEQPLQRRIQFIHSRKPVPTGLA